MGADSSKNERMFRKLTPDEQLRSNNRRKRARVQAMDTVATRKQQRERHKAKERPVSIVSLSGLGERNGSSALKPQSTQQFRQVRQLEPLMKLPPIQSNGTAATGAKRPKIRPPPTNQSFTECKDVAPTLERNLTLLSVASMSDSVPELTPRGYKQNNTRHKLGLANRNVPVTNRQMKQSTGYGDNLAAPRNGLTPIEDKTLRPELPPFIKQTPSTSFQNTTAVGGPTETVDNHQPNPLMERNMTLMSLMSDL